jgi:hypothetical protein
MRFFSLRPPGGARQDPPDQSLLHSEARITGSFTISCGNPTRHYSQDTSHALPDPGNASVDGISRGP